MSAEIQPLIAHNRKLIGLSNMGQNDQPLAYAHDAIQSFMGGYRDVLVDTTAKPTNEARDAQAEQLKTAFGKLNIKTFALHQLDPDSRLSAIMSAQGFYIGGGNTGLLSASMYATRHENGKTVDPTSTANTTPLAEYYRDAVANGVPMIGHSAGTMMMAEDIRTFGLGDNLAFLRRSEKGLHIDVTGLNLLSDGLVYHPHFDGNNELFNEMLEADHELTILAAKNGTYFTVSGMHMNLGGETSATLFKQGSQPRELKAGQDISYLLKQ